MSATQTIKIKGRPYTFTTEGAETRLSVSTVGSLFNSRGQWAGFVNRVHQSGRYVLIGGPRAIEGVLSSTGPWAGLE
jgi:hypothetical protein